MPVVQRDVLLCKLSNLYLLVDGFGSWELAHNKTIRVLRGHKSAEFAVVAKHKPLDEVLPAPGQSNKARVKSRMPVTTKGRANLNNDFNAWHRCQVHGTFGKCMALLLWP